MASYTGVTSRLGKLSLQEFGSLSGEVTLTASSGVKDFAGVTVYIPGTSYSALTDPNGKYSISNVPPGVHYLFAEKDGFNRGQVGNVVVNSKENTAVSKIALGLATIENGTYLVENSFINSNKTYIGSDVANLLMLPPSTASLMMVKTNFSEGLWRPITTNYDLSMDLDLAVGVLGNNKDYLVSPFAINIIGKYADTNGLESDQITKEYYLDLFASNSTLFTPSFDLAYNSASNRIEASNITVPSQADAMSIEIKHANDYSSSGTLLFKPFNFKLRQLTCRRNEVWYAKGLDHF